MEKEFVPYELAVKLKELGFDEPCLGFYRDNDRLNAVDQHWGSGISGISKSLGYSIDDLTLAPTFSQVFRWFREKHGLFVAPSAISYEGGPYLWFFEINSTTIPFGTDLGVTDDFKTYEEAELACLNKLIEIVKQK